MNFWRSILLCITVVTSFSACSRVNQEQSGISMIDFSKTKTIYIGRVQLTLPKETEINYGTFNYNGSEVGKENNMGPQAFQDFVRGKIEEYKKEPHNTEGTLLTDVVVGPVKDNLNQALSYIIVHRSTKYSTEIYQVDGYIWLWGKVVSFKSQVETEDLQQGIANTQYNLKHVHTTDQKNKEKTQGMYWQDIFIEEDDESAKKNRYNTSVAFFFPSYPHVLLEFDYRIRYKSDTPYIAMVRENQAKTPLEIKALIAAQVVREQEKEVHGFKGEESITYGRRRAHIERGFEVGGWSVLGSLEDYREPNMMLRLDSAQNQPNNSVVNQPRVMQLYDFVLNSIQPTPNNAKEQANGR